jgi:ubiquinone/menaquinone biosynthesis C-methylase UbiE
MKPEEYQVMYQLEDTLWWYRGMEAITRRLIERYFTRGQGLNILDAGCGTGAAMGYLADYGEVTGVDFSPFALQLSRRRGKTRLARGSVTELPFCDAAFDLVTSFDVLCLQGVDDVQAMIEFRRVLVPGGRVILRLPACNWLRGTHDAAVDIGHRYAAGEIRACMAKAGLTAEHISYANMWLFPIAVLKRWSERFLPRQSGSDLTLSVGPLNGLFRHILAGEAGLVAGRGLSFGLSVVAVGRKA